jgi:hypothetical protein
MSWVQKRIGQGGAVSYTATYRDPAGRGRSAGTFTSRREAERAGRRAESKVEDGSWLDRAAGRITFEDYVEGVWWPSRHLEVSTRAGYRSNLDKHFLPYFGAMAMADILPSTVQGWVTAAVAAGLSARSVVKYHVMLHGVFKRAVRDRVIGYNPCADTELPKVIPAKVRIVAPEDFDRLLAEIPARHEALVLTAIVVEETILEVSKRHSPTGERMIVKPYPKNDEARTLRVSPALVEILASHQCPGARARSPAVPVGGEGGRGTDVTQHVPHQGVAAGTVAGRPRFPGPDARLCRPPRYADLDGEPVGLSGELTSVGRHNALPW